MPVPAILARVLAGTAVRTAGGIVASGIAGAVRTVSGIGSAVGALSDIAEDASKEKDTSESKSNVIYVNFGMAGSAGKQKITGSGTLPAKPAIATPQVSEKMPTERLLDMAVEYLISIDKTLKQQLESDRVNYERQKKDAREASIENKPSVFSDIKNRLSGLTSAAKEAPGTISKMARYALVLGGAAALIASALDEDEISKLKENVDRFIRGFEAIVNSLTNYYSATYNDLLNPDGEEGPRTAYDYARGAARLVFGGGLVGSYIRTSETRENATRTSGTAPTASRSVATTDAEQVTASSPAATNLGAGRSAVAGNVAVLDAIAKAEGTYNTGYNTSLGYGAYLPGGREHNLTNMTLSEILQLQERMLRHPNNRFNSSALGRYQIVSITLRDAARSLGMNLETTKFNQVTQDRMAMWIVENQGLGAWTGFRRHPDQRAIAEAALRSGPRGTEPEHTNVFMNAFQQARGAMESVAGAPVAAGTGEASTESDAAPEQRQSITERLLNTAASMFGTLGSAVVRPGVERTFTPSTPNVSERIASESMQVQNDITLGIRRHQTREEITTPALPGIGPSVTRPAKTLSSIDPNYGNIDSVARYLAHFRLAA